MLFRMVVVGAALAVGAASLGTASAQASKASRADAFTLDGLSATAAPAPDTVAPVLPPPAVPDTAAARAAPATPAAATPAAATPAAGGGLRPSFTLDTPIAVLIADPAARAVLDRDLPGMSTDENLDKFAKLGLRQFQPLTGGQLTEAMLGKVARDLSALGGPMLAPIVPAAGGGTSRRNRDASR